MAVAEKPAPAKSAPKSPAIKKQQLDDIRVGLGLGPGDELPDCLEEEYLKRKAIWNRMGFTSNFSPDTLLALCHAVLEIEAKKSKKKEAAA
jgi:hypothetical protein